MPSWKEEDGNLHVRADILLLQMILARGNQYVGRILAEYETRQNEIMDAGDDGMF